MTKKLTKIKVKEKNLTQVLVEQVIFIRMVYNVVQKKKSQMWAADRSRRQRSFSFFWLSTLVTEIWQMSKYEKEKDERRLSDRRDRSPLKGI